MAMLPTTLIPTLLLFTATTLFSEISAQCPSSSSTTPSSLAFLPPTFQFHKQKSLEANKNNKNYRKSWNSYTHHHDTLTPTTTSTILSMTTTSNTKDDDIITTIKSTILETIQPTKRGLSTTPTQKSNIETQIQQLESLCPLSEPARNTLMQGKWLVEYTTAPPPSNGKLGPFVGTARQVIDLETRRYANVLTVDPGEWLSATLDATWEEWDGVFLEKKGGFDGDNVTAAVVADEDEDEDPEVIENKGNDSPLDSVLNWFRQSAKSSPKAEKSKKPDYGATSWKVDFDTLTIKLFGVPIVTKQFQDTSRVWRMSYLDDDTRVVRAGQTGKSEDDVVFYMTRE